MAIDPIQGSSSAQKQAPAGKDRTRIDKLINRVSLAIIKLATSPIRLAKFIVRQILGPMVGKIHQTRSTDYRYLDVTESKTTHAARRVFHGPQQAPSSNKEKIKLSTDSIAQVLIGAESQSVDIESVRETWGSLIEGAEDGEFRVGLSDDDKTKINQALQDVNSDSSILEVLGKGNRCYIPINCSQNNKVVLVFEKQKDGKIAYYFMSKGGESKGYPIIKVGGKTYRSYRSPKRVLNPDIPFDDVIQNTVNQWKNKETGLEEILYGFYHLSIPDKIDTTLDESFATTSQNSSSTPDQLLRLIIKDTLLSDQKPSKLQSQLDKYKRLIVNEKLVAVRAIADKDNKPQTEYAKRHLISLLNEAAHSFLQSQRKGYISENELKTLTTITTEVRDQINTQFQAADPLQPVLSANGKAIETSIPLGNNQAGATRGQILNRATDIYNPPDSIADALAVMQQPFTSCSISNARGKQLMDALPLPVSDSAKALWRQELNTNEKKQEFIAKASKIMISNGWNTDQARQSEKHYEALLHWHLHAINLFLLRECDPPLLPEGVKISTPIEMIQNGVVCHLAEDQKAKSEIISLLESENAREGDDLYGFLALGSDDFGKFFKKAYEDMMAKKNVRPEFRGIMALLGNKASDFEGMCELASTNVKNFKSNDDLAWYRCLFMTQAMANASYLSTIEWKASELATVVDKNNHTQLYGVFELPPNPLAKLNPYAFTANIAVTPLRPKNSDQTGAENKVLATAEVPEKLSAPFFGDHVVMSDYPSTRIGALIGWVEENKHLLRDEATQAYLEQGFLSGTTYMEAIGDEPLLEAQLQKMIKENVDPINLSNMSQILFLVRLGYAAESHAVASGREPNEEWRNFLDEVTEKSIDFLAKGQFFHSQGVEKNKFLAEAYSLHAMMLADKGAANSEILTKAAANLWASSLISGGHKSVTYKLASHLIISKLDPTVLEPKADGQYIDDDSASSGEDLQALFNTQIAIYMKEILNLDGDVNADFSTGSLTVDGKALTLVKGDEPLPSEFEVILGSQAAKMHVEGGVFMTPDRRFRYDGVSLQMLHEGSWWSYYPYKVTGVDRYLWAKSADTYISTDTDFNVIMKRTPTDGLLRKHKGSYSLKCCKIKDMTPESNTFLSQLSDNYFVWQNVDAADTNSRITAIELPSWDNLLIYRDEDKMRCDAFPKHQLSAKQGVILGDRVDGVINLVADGDSSDSIVLVPYRQFSEQSPHESNSIFEMRTGGGQGYYSYRLDEKTGLLASDEEGGYLYLATVYAKLGKYDLALTYLNREPQMTNSKRIKNIIVQALKDPSIAPTFSLHLVIRLIHDMKVNKDTVVLGLEIEERLAKRVSAYLTGGRSTLGSLEGEVRIDDAEMEMLLDYMFSIPGAVYENKYIMGGDLKREGVTLEYCRLKGINPSVYTTSREQYWPSRPLNNGFNPNSPGSIQPPNFDDPDSITIEQLRAYPAEVVDHYHKIGFKLAEESAKRNQGDKKLKGSWHQDDVHFYRLAQSSDDVDIKLLSLIKIARYNPDFYKWKYINNLKGSVPSDHQTHAIESVTLPLIEKITPSKTKPRAEQFTRPTLSSNVEVGAKILNAISDGYYEETESSLPEEGIDSPFSIERKETALAKGIREGIKAEHNKLRTAKVTTYHVDNDNEEALKVTVNSELTKSKARTQELKDSINTTLSTHDTDIHDLEVMERGGRDGDFRDVLLAVATGNSLPLRQKCPWLTQADYQKIAPLALELMQEGSKCDQLEEAKTLIDRGDFSGAGSVLAKKRNYDPAKHPILLYYEYATGMILRDEPDQAKLLIDMFDILFKDNPNDNDKAALRRICFEFQAGGGKTKVISVLMAAQAIGKGKLPIFFSLPQLFDVSKQDLHSVLSSVFEQNVCHIDLGMQDEVTPTRVRNLFTTLKNKQAQGACIVMAPETFHCLNLAWQAALSDGDTVLIEELKPFRNYLKDNALYLIDESHRNVDALLIANKAMGTPEPMGDIERKLLLSAYRILTGLDHDDLKLTNGSSLAETLKIRSNGQAGASDEAKREALDIMANTMVNDLKLDLSNQEAIIDWIRSCESEMPKELVKWGSGTKKQRQNLQSLAFIRGLSLDILPHCLNQIGEMDYGQSEDPTVFIATPRNQKTPVDANFENADIAAALTVQEALFNGLKKTEAMRALLRDLILEAKEERERNTQKEPTIAVKFRQWQNSQTPMELENITEHWIANNTNIDHLIEQLGDDPEVIDRYLRIIALPKVLTFPKKMTSTGKDLVTSSWGSVLFSATLGGAELYPDMELPENYWQDNGFLARVFGRASLDQNRTVRYEESSNALGLMKSLGDEMATVNGIIDVGFWSKEESSEDWAQAFNTFAIENPSLMEQYHGALFFKEDENGVKALYLLQKGGTQPHRLPTTDLKKLGLADKKLFCIYGADETTGTDLYLPPDARMITTVGESTGIRSTAQGVMRMRGFLKNPVETGNSQRTLWVVPSALKSRIEEAANGNSELSGVLTWMVDNEASREKETLIARGYQEIEGVIREEIERRISLEPNPKKKAALFRKYESAFIYDTTRSIIANYGSTKGEKSTEELMQEYARTFAKNAHVTPDAKMQKRIEQVISDTKKRVETMTVGTHALNNTTQQTTQQISVVRQQQAVVTPKKTKISPKRLYTVEDYAVEGQKGDLQNLALKDKTLFSSFGLEKLGCKMRAGRNCLQFSKDVNTYKPIRFFLLIQKPNGQREYIAVSSDDAREYKNQLKEGKVKEGHKIALMSDSGVLIQNGREDSGIEKIPDDDEFKGELNALAFYNGKIRDEEWLKAAYDNDPVSVHHYWNSLKSRFLYNEELFNDTEFRKVCQIQSDKGIDGIGGGVKISVTEAPKKSKPVALASTKFALLETEEILILVSPYQKITNRIKHSLEKFVVS